MSFRTFEPRNARGGCKMVPSKTALILIEYQNEFTSPGGKLHESVKDTMNSTDMLNKSLTVVNKARSMDVKVIHAPITFAEDASDNPNKSLGILAGCAKDKLFVQDTWNSDICDIMKPIDSNDIIIRGKKGLDAFPDTDLEHHLKTHDIETVVLCGFLANCCVESTMRTACEKGFNVITLTDCTAATTQEGLHASIDGTWNMFSTPMNASEFLSML